MNSHMSELRETVAELHELLAASWAEEPGPWVAVDGNGIFTTMERHVGDARPAAAALIVALHEALPQLLAAAEAVERISALADDLVQASEYALERAEKARPWGDEHRSDAATYRHCAKRIREALAAADPTLATVAGEETT